MAGPGRRPGRGLPREQADELALRLVAARRAARTPSATPSSARLDQVRTLQPGLVPVAADARLRRLRRPVRRRPRRRARPHPVPARARRHLPAPDAAAAAARRATATAATRSPTTAPCAPTSARWTTCARWPPTLRAAGISLVLDLVLNHVAREHAVGAGRPGGRRRAPRVLPRLRRPRPARRLRAHAAGGVPRLRARQLHLGRRAGRAGCGRRSTPSSGTSTGPTRDVFAGVRRHRAVPGQRRGRGAAAGRDRVPLEAAGHQLPEPARGARDHPGAARADPDRLPCGRFQGRGDRRAGGPGAATSARAATTARSAIWPTTTA